jgi:hypothetical protein
LEARILVDSNEANRASGTLFCGGPLQFEMTIFVYGPFLVLKPFCNDPAKLALSFHRVHTFIVEDNCVRELLAQSRLLVVARI